MEHILSILIFFPVFAAIIGLLVQKDAIRVYGIVVTAMEFLLSCILWYNYDVTNGSMHFTEFIPIISQYGIKVMVHLLSYFGVIEVVGYGILERISMW